VDAESLGCRAENGAIEFPGPLRNRPTEGPGVHRGHSGCPRSLPAMLSDHDQGGPDGDRACAPKTRFLNSRVRNYFGAIRPADASRNHPGSQIKCRVFRRPPSGSRPHQMLGTLQSAAHFSSGSRLLALIEKSPAPGLQVVAKPSGRSPPATETWGRAAAELWSCRRRRARKDDGFIGW